MNASSLPHTQDIGFGPSVRPASERVEACSEAANSWFRSGGYGRLRPGDPGYRRFPDHYKGHRAADPYDRATYYSIVEFARYLGVSRDYGYQLRRSGGIPCVDRGVDSNPRYLIRKPDAQKYKRKWLGYDRMPVSERFLRSKSEGQRKLGALLRVAEDICAFRREGGRYPTPQEVRAALNAALEGL